MMHRALALLATASLVVLGACGDDTDTTGTTTGSTATVRFVNATNTNMNVSNAGTVGGNSGLGFGGTSSCMNVNTSGVSGTGLGFTNTSTNATIGNFSQNFTSGGNYTVVAYTDASGNTQYATINNNYTPTSGQAGLTIFNAAAGSGNVIGMSNGANLNSGLTSSFGTTGSYFSVPTGAQSFTFNTGTGTAPFAGTSGTLVAGQNNVLVLGPAASGSTALRSFVAAGC